MKLIRIIAMLSALTVAIVTVASAYAGSVNPQSWALPSVLAMIFPAMLLLTVILIIVNLFICRKAAIVGVASLLCCLSPALDVCPLNFSEPAADSEPLTLLTYNVMQLTDFTGTSVSDSPNPTLRMLASSEADIIALQECYDIASIAAGEANRPLLDSISRHYPYRSYGARGQSLLSRFPFDEIILSRPNADDFRVRAFRIYIGTDTITLFDVHLQSIGLTPDDKQLYRDLTRGDTQGRGIKGEIREIRSDLISKLTEAFRARALQTAALTDMIAETGGKLHRFAATSTTCPDATPSDRSPPPDCATHGGSRRSDPPSPTTPTGSTSASTTYSTARSSSHRCAHDASHGHTPTTTPSK